MKRKLNFLAAVLLLSLCSAPLYAQRDVITGSNLDIGTDNTLFNGLSGRPTGNAIGLQNVLNSIHSLAVGANDTIDSNSSYAVSLGASNYIQGEAAMGFGRSVKIDGFDNIGIGQYIRVNGRSSSMVFGSGIKGTDGADACTESITRQ